MFRPLRKRLGLALSVALLIGGASAPSAQAQAGPLSQGPRVLPAAEVVEKVSVEQNLDTQLPLDLTFRDASGQTVQLGDLFRGKPVILVPVYYECPSLCSMTLNGLVKSFRPLTFSIGEEYDVITFSFDPTETSELAAAKKANYVEDYGRPTAEAGWHFLTGDQANIDKLCEAIGFRYVYDEGSEQYAHASAIMVITPKGRISRYFYGLEYSSRDLRLGLVEAADEKIGTLADDLKLLCFAYDPSTGKYGWAIMSILRAGGVLTLAALGTFMFVSIRREKKQNQAVETADPKQQ